MYFSISTSVLPNEDAASRWHETSASAKSSGASNPPHPLAAAARDRLDQHGIADRRRLRRQPIGRLIRAEITRRHRHARRDHALLGGILQPHRADAVGIRADPDNPGVDHGLREIGIFRQEAITRMDRLRARRACCGDDLLAHQIAFARRRRADMHRLVRLPHVQRLGVRIRIDRDRAHAHRPRGTDDAARNLAAIGDEEGLDHPAQPVVRCDQVTLSTFHLPSSRTTSNKSYPQ